MIKNANHVKINSVNTLYLIFHKVNGYIEQLIKISDASSY